LFCCIEPQDDELGPPRIEARINEHTQRWLSRNWAEVRAARCRAAGGSSNQGDHSGPSRAPVQDESWSQGAEKGDEMEYRQLGNSALNVSAIGLGGNTFGPPRIDEAMTHRVIDAAQELGINFVDTAAGYGEGRSEEYIGTAMQGRRDRWVIATKFNFRGMGDARARDYIQRTCEASLRKLQTDYIDLYQLHQPNLDVPEDELLRAFDDLVRSGKVRTIGASNHTAWHMAQNVYTARLLGVQHYATAQDHYNVLRRQIEAELVGFCTRFGISIIPYFPLAGGFLTGKYRRGEPPPARSRGAEGSGIIKRNSTDRNYAIVPELEAFAAERGHTVTELALAWLLASPAVGAVITGVSNPEQVAMNAMGASWRLTPEEKVQVDRIAPREGDDSGQPVGARAALQARA
jgi:aryl-alcohol dehydrogenase-like predicted oxidoreductase